jgi:hypothetical protein
LTIEAGVGFRAAPVRIETCSDQVMIGLPTDVHEDTVRLEVEHLVHELLVRCTARALGSGLKDGARGLRTPIEVENEAEQARI